MILSIKSKFNIFFILFLWIFFYFYIIDKFPLNIIFIYFFIKSYNYNKYNILSSLSIVILNSINKSIDHIFSIYTFIINNIFATYNILNYEIKN